MASAPEHPEPAASHAAEPAPKVAVAPAPSAAKRAPEPVAEKKAAAPATPAAPSAAAEQKQAAKPAKVASVATVSTTPPHSPTAEKDHGAAHWSYFGAEGAEKWGDIDPSFATCKTGAEQSPINIVSANSTKAKLDKLEFNYLPSRFAIANNGHTVQVDYDPGSHIKVGAQKYELVQFHFHTPSEEEIDGKEFDMVMHLVHRSAEGKLAVVAVLFDRGGENPFLKSFWERLPRDSGESRSLPTLPVRVAEVLPLDKSYFTYMGSLTTPPCSEGVRWFVLKTPVGISKAQTTAFRRIHPMNNRPVQALGSRVVKDGG
jgi:carbonic anhydrase